MVMLLYSTGIRLSELSYLRITDIDSKNMRVKVVQGKGSKDRYTILSETVLLELRAYYIQYRPVEYLFNGMGKGAGTASEALRKWYKMPSLKQALQTRIIPFIPSGTVLPPTW